MKSTFPLVSAIGIACIGGLVSAKIGTPPAISESSSAKIDAARAIGKARDWVQASSDIPADDKVIYGTLENGMRYIICKNPLPQSRVSMRLHVDAGSLNEADDQRGVAHFLEHMVFNGTRHFPDATKLIPQMQRLGIAFGAHANAYTSFDETVYMLDLPNIDKSTLDLGFAVMGDFADGALLSNPEIDEERGVIASEKTSRDSVGLRMFEKQFAALLPNSVIKDRLPIGTDEVIATAPRERFVDFYTRFYTPEKMTFVYVGDLDVEKAEQTIRATFGAIKNPKTPGAKATLGDMSKPAGLLTTVLSDKELSTSEVSIIRTLPSKLEMDNKAQRLLNLQASLANQILSRRFSRITKQENATITDGSSSLSPFFRELKLGSISVTAVNNDWKAAIPTLENEFRRALNFGFTESEYREAVAEITNTYEQAVFTASTRKSDQIASDLVIHAHDDLVYSTPETDLAVLKENLAQTSPQSIHTAFKDFWLTEDIHLVLTTQKADSSAESALAKIYKTSQAIALEAPTEKAAATFAYAERGKPGTITAEKLIEDLEIHQFTLSNGIKVNFKQTDFSKNSISMTTSFGTGQAGMPLDKPGLNTLASAMINAGGLGKHSIDELQTILAGRSVGVGFTIAEDSLKLSGKTTPADLKLQLQLLTAYLTDPGFRPEAYRQYQTNLPSYYSQLAHTEQGALAQMRGWYAGHDGRFTLPTLEQAQALTIEDVTAWLSPQFADHALELSIVGDVKLEDLKAAVTSTLGTLPERNVSQTIEIADRSLTPPARPAEQSFTYDSKIQKAIAIVLWQFDDVTDRDIKKMRRAGILADILDDRLRIELREKRGIAYSPYVGASLSDTFRNGAKLMAYSPGKPQDTEKVGKIIVELADTLAKEGATADELERVLKPKMGMLAKSSRQNGYWLGTVMDRSTTFPAQLDAARSRDKDYTSLKLEDINQLAKTVFVKENSARISISPSSK